MKYQKSQQIVSALLARCEKENVNLPEDPYDALQEVSSALKSSHGKEEDALKVIKHRCDVQKRHHTAPEGNGGGESEEHEDMPPHKRARLIDEVCDHPAKCAENQKIVDAFLEYGRDQLARGHTGKAVTHLRAAAQIRDYDKPIKSGWDATHVGYVGDKMGAQVEEVLQTGKITDKSADQNVTKDYEHHLSTLVTDIRDTPAKCKENQKIVDAMADFGEYHLKSGNTGKGSSHLRAAREIHNSDVVIKSARQAQSSIPYIGDVFADKIDQILEHGKIVHDVEHSSDAERRRRGDPAPIVKDLAENPAKQKENQKIVDALREYGDSHLRGGNRGKGISHLRAAKEIRNSDMVITSGAEATQIGMVGKNVAYKIDQILRQGHADSDEDYAEGDDQTEGEEVVDVEEEASSEYGKPHPKGHPTPLVTDVKNHPAACKENQRLVDALVEFGETKLEQRDTGRGVTYLRAARQLCDAKEAIKSGSQAKKVGMIGDKVAHFIHETLQKSG